MNKPPASDDPGRTLRLLELIHQNGTLTQRELSRRMGIALGLVNLSLKRLMREELIKVSKLSPRRMVYLLTPGGMAEKGRLSTRFLSDSFSMYRSARRAFLRHFAELRDNGQRRVMLYGDGPVAEAAFLTLQELKLELVGVAGTGGPFLGRDPLDAAQAGAHRVDRVLFAGAPEALAECREWAGKATFSGDIVVDLNALLLEEPV
ncbi:MAG: winged helix-turn-helix transcriptional regulator [Nitrospirota bacterium]|nr:winged helix-turn-helix transcriptional regulator [Nitrospirota bacterium]